MWVGWETVVHSRDCLDWLWTDKPHKREKLWQRGEKQLIEMIWIHRWSTSCTTSAAHWDYPCGKLRQLMNNWHGTHTHTHTEPVLSPLLSAREARQKNKSKLHKAVRRKKWHHVLKRRLIIGRGRSETATTGFWYILVHSTFLRKSFTSPSPGYPDMQATHRKKPHDAVSWWCWLNSWVLPALSGAWKCVCLRGSLHHFDSMISKDTCKMCCLCCVDSQAVGSCSKSHYALIVFNVCLIVKKKKKRLQHLRSCLLWPGPNVLDDGQDWSHTMIIFIDWK